MIFRRHIVTGSYNVADISGKGSQCRVRLRKACYSSLD